MSGLLHANTPKPKGCRVCRYDIQDFTYAELRQSAKKSCRLCGLFVKILEAIADGCFPALFQGAKDKSERADFLKQLRSQSNLESGGTLLEYLSISLMGNVSAVEISREFDIEESFTVEGVSIPPIEQHQFFNIDYPDWSLSRARAWLRQCLEQHSCGKSDFCPKRLLNVHENPVRLFETNDIKNFKEPYVCLSHRWGSPKHKRFTSTVANIHNHKEGIAWDEIPKTFQDAITICRRMSVNYLWIDTVCILQAYPGMSGEDAAKTEADFAAENSAMARIYQNSQFTIYATMSTSMESGIFSGRNDGHQIKVTGDDGTEATLRVTMEHWHDTPPTDLETRGWTYQEYLLPSRILEFGPVEISWRCQEEHLCECSGKGQNLNSDLDWREELSRQARPPKRTSSEAEQWWIRTIQYYTARKLTNCQDKLPALSGLAQIYHKVTGDIYLAGLWKASLPYSLCWYHCSGTDERPPPAIGIGCRPQAYRAPSWSWASIDALNNAQCRTWWPRTVEKSISLIYYRAFEETDPLELCTIYEVDVQPRTGDPFGQVAPGGFLELGVTLISARIDTSKAEPWDLYYFMERFKGEFAWTLNSVNVEDANVGFFLPDCELRDDGLEHGDEVYCAPIVEHLTRIISEIGCLVLKRLRDQEYRRVGFCILAKETPDKRAWKLGCRPEHQGRPVERPCWAHWSLDTKTRIRIV